MSNIKQKKSSALPVKAEYILQLVITGATRNSTLAVQNIKIICEEHLKNRYRLDIIDIYQQPQLAEQNQIIAVPTLIKLKPEPTKCLIGDLSDIQSVLVSLNLR